MGKQYGLIPRKVAAVDTKYRTIKTEIPNAQSIRVIEQLRKYEPKSMSGQPPVVWDKAQGINVFDAYGNKWIDLSSCVVVANTGHGNSEVKKAIRDMVDHGLLNNYCFPSAIRGELTQKIIEVTATESLNKVFLLTTGGESTECAIKLARTYGQKKGGQKKIKIIGFEDAFHGRTMGAQMAGGIPKGKSWIVNLDKDMLQVPFPNSFKYEWADQRNADYSDERCFEIFLKNLKNEGVDDFKNIAGIMTETFQGGWCQLMPKGFAQKLRNFCTENDIVLIYDEIQAGFGRTAKMFGFQHSDIVPDIVCCGKGISSSLPLSCVIGREDIMDLFGPNEMTSTHTGNPVCAAATLASINYLIEKEIIKNCEKMSHICKGRLNKLKEKYNKNIGFVSGIGLAWAVILVKEGTKEIDCDLAHDVVRISMEKGVLMFAPVGAGATLKICPPLVINEEALNEAIDVLDEAIAQALYEKK
ncbi:MAG: aspartate aminotransferase family protein [Eubacteriales bacterium]|nr:aspartate aminotransferase family protein [Eubacteriales bacterium]